jgi:hypothetical protein
VIHKIGHQDFMGGILDTLTLYAVHIIILYHFYVSVTVHQCTVVPG